MPEKIWDSSDLSDLDIAVLIPCYNEETSIGEAVRGFKAPLPVATIYVYDNNSRDETVRVARAAGAVIRREPHQGKGNVVRRMFADVDADIYILVDGDDTYDAQSAPAMVLKLLNEQLDMVCGQRITEIKAAYRPGHKLGNWLLTGVVQVIFGNYFNDMLTGYRVFSRRFVKSFPALTTGFEIETELTVHALELRMPTAEVPTPYRDRPAGSTSKLRTVHDGIRILATILVLVKEERPFQFFATVFVVLVLISFGLGIPILRTFVDTGLVPRLPTAVLATGIMLLAFLSLVCGLILDTVTRGRREAKRMRYLDIPAAGSRTVQASATVGARTADPTGSPGHSGTNSTPAQPLRRA
jgi:hypothetical protein